ncbi:MAG: 50S ribosomal protein L25 [Patescibacteria group bacterium]|nr:50S ribosomal protein L25 [Patescibacteria group bacterium]
MLSLSAKIRKDLGKRVKTLRKKGIIPGVLYGPKVEATALQLDEKEFEKVYEEAGESSLISLEVTGQADKKEKYLVLIHEIARDPLTEKPIHVDFYQPKLEEEVEVIIPIIFEGTSPAVKDLGGTLVKNISELKVKALPQKLPHEIRVDVSQLKSFEDNILIKDLKLAEGVKISRAPEEILAFVAPPEKIEEELEKPIEEKVEEVEKVEKEKKEEVTSDE